MSNVKFYYGENVPLEMHKVRIVQKLNLVSIERRLEAIKEAGNNTFLLKNRDVFMDMLTDSGVNAMSDKQLAAMMEPMTVTLVLRLFQNWKAKSQKFLEKSIFFLHIREEPVKIFFLRDL